MVDFFVAHWFAALIISVVISGILWLLMKAAESEPTDLSKMLRKNYEVAKKIEDEMRKSRGA